MNSLEKGMNALMTLVERVLAVALIAGIVLNFINVIGRYLSGYTLAGADEVEIYILIWIAFMGAAAVTWRGEHLRMDVLMNACPLAIRKLAAALEMLVLFSVASFVAYQSFRYVERIYSLGVVSDIAHIPTWIPHSAIPISFAAMAIMVILRGIQELTGSGPVASSTSHSEAKS